MRDRWNSAAIFALLAGVGYVPGALVVVLTSGGDSLPVVAGLAILGAPLAVVAGAVFGKVAHQRRKAAKVAGSLALGAATPFVALWLVLTLFSAQDAVSRAAYDARSRSTFEQARADGFPFPANATPAMEGQAWSTDPVATVRDFYDRETKSTWERKAVQNTAWYVRKANSGRYDRIWIKQEYGRTAIYFGNVDRDKVELMSATAFSQSAAAGNWEAALSWCEPSLAKQLGLSGLKRTFTETKPTSSAFVRSTSSYGGTTRIAVNASHSEGRSGFRTVEVGFTFTPDPIPLIRRIEMPSW